MGHLTLIALKISLVPGPQISSLLGLGFWTLTFQLSTIPEHGTCLLIIGIQEPSIQCSGDLESTFSDQPIGNRCIRSEDRTFFFHIPGTKPPHAP